MIKKFGKYIVKKISGNLVGRTVKYGFWTAMCFFGPITVVSTVGVPVVAVAAITAHSGIVEYGTSKALGKVLWVLR